MILAVHPFGNANVRAVLAALENANRLGKFVTTLGWSTSSPILEALPEKLRTEMMRRGYDLPPYEIKTHPMREILRLLAQKMGLRSLTRHETGWASIDRVWSRLDQVAADYLRESRERLGLRGVYAYEDCALRLFEAAQQLGVRRIYDLPIAYWETAQRLLRAEADRYPDWEPTLGGTRDSEEKLARKTRELDLAEIVICPSAFVLESLPEQVRGAKHCLVAPFGSPPGTHEFNRTYDRPLRFLFAGALSQRKGLADLFAAIKLVRSPDAELVVMGSAILPMQFYRDQFPSFTYEAPRAHAAVLRLMQSCDVLILPSIVEGRALVQQEAMACGLPLIVTRNAGGEDLIIEGETGFLVPAGSPAVIAEKIEWFLENRARLPGMSVAARAKAAELTWPTYGAKILHAIGD